MTSVTTETDDTEKLEAHPRLDDLLTMAKAGLGGDGWGQLDNASLGKLLDAQLTAQRQAMRKEAIAFRECFSTAAGRAVLKALLDQTLRTVAWPLFAMQDAQMLTAFGIWREAQNSFVAGIIEAMAAADNVDIKQRSDT